MYKKFINIALLNRLIKMRERVVTGIKNLDNMLYGGIPLGNQVVLAGGPGSGKTLLSFEYLYHGAERNERGVLFSLEEDKDMIIENAKSAFTEFTKIDEFVNNGLVNIIGTEETQDYMRRDSNSGSFNFGDMVSQIVGFVEAKHINRVVLDSISTIKLLIKDSLEYRNLTLGLVRLLRRAKATSIMTTELENPKEEQLIFQPEFFMYDGIIALYFSGSGSNIIQTLEVVKMRGSNHSFAIAPYEITSHGINIINIPDIR